MPTRTAMVLAQNGASSAGDPFLGTLIRGGFAIAKGIGRLFKGKAQRVLTKGAAGTAITTRGRTVALAGRAAPILRRVGAAAGLGAAFEIGSRVIGFDEAGQPILGKKRRRRGITATELRGFRKVTSLLHRVGMTPRGLRGRVHHHHA